jgi:hypothetical protein
VYSRDIARLCASKPAEGRSTSRVGRSHAEFRAARSRVVRQVMLLVGAGVVAAAVVAQSAAAAGWSIQPAPKPMHSGGAWLSGVSCTSRRDCVAVGESLRQSTFEPIPLVEHWNGTSWSIERTPIPTGHHWMGFLAAVSCASVRACTAVGSYFSDDSGTFPLAERWNGSSWSIQRTPQPVDADQFDGVSCASSTACIAVGNGQQSFAQRWDGKHWSVEKIHFGDPQERANALAGVSCPSQGTCVAVGWDDIGICSDPYESDYDVPVLGSWTSGRWSLRRHPDLACSNSRNNGGGSGPDAVSCTSTAACTAVGSAVYRWDGRRWSVQPAPIGSDELAGVSCTSNTACTAVGSRIYRWNGRGWSSEPMPHAAGAKAAGLSSVSCTSPESCVAVGGYEDRRETDHLLVESIGVGGDGAETARQANASSGR